MNSERTKTGEKVGCGEKMTRGEGRLEKVDLGEKAGFLEDSLEKLDYWEKMGRRKNVG